VGENTKVKMLTKFQ